MEALQIVDWVEVRLRLMGVTVPNATDILQICNDENVRTARDLGIPTRYIKDVDATQPFAPPLEAWPASIRFVELTERNERITVYTVSEANDFFPDWEKNATEGDSRYPAKLIIYDPVNITAPVYPIGFQTGDTLRMTYVVKVKPMVFADATTEESLEPWNGVLPEYHRVIPQLAVFNLLLLSSRGQDVALQQAARAFYNDAQGDLADAFNSSRHAYNLPRVQHVGEVMPSRSGLRITSNYS